MSSPNLSTQTTQSQPTRFGKSFNRWLNQRIPPQKKITLAQRSIFIFPSKVGAAFFALLFLLLFGAINYQNSLIYGITFLLGSLFLVAILHTYKNLAGLTLEFVHSRPGFVGENIEFVVTISQPEGNQREGIQLGWPSGLKQWAHLQDSNADTVQLFVPAKARGWMNPGRLLIEAYYPLGLLRAWSWIDFESRALVYPKPIFEQAAVESDINNDEGEVIQRDDNDDFYEMRSYQEGDPIKHIAWRNYARSDELMVKQFAGHKDRQLMLDWQQLHGNDEYRLSCLTGLALRANRNEQEFGLRIPGIEIKPNSGNAHLDNMLRELALYDLAK